MYRIALVVCYPCTNEMIKAISECRDGGFFFKQSLYLYSSASCLQTPLLCKQCTVPLCEAWDPVSYVYNRDACFVSSECNIDWSQLFLPLAERLKQLHKVKRKTDPTKVMKILLFCCSCSHHDVYSSEGSAVLIRGQFKASWETSVWTASEKLVFLPVS